MVNEPMAEPSRDPASDDDSLTATSPHGRLFAVGLADVVFGVLAYSILLTANQGMLDDPGLGWHLRNVDAMWRQGGWLTVDSFSIPQSATWYSNQWIGDCLLRLGEWWGGLEGIAVVVTIVLAFALRLLFRMLCDDGVSWPLSLLWTYLAALATSSSWVARPNVFTILFVLIVARWCQQFHVGRMSAKRLLWVFPLFVIWANTHGGFVAGLITLAAALVIEAGWTVSAPDSESRLAARRRLGPLAFAGALAVAGTLVNPYGLSLYSWVFGLLGDSYFMNLNIEWHSPDFHSASAFRYEILMLLLPTLIAFSRRRPDVVSVGLAVLWLHFALQGRRYIPLWAVVVIPMLARLSMDLPVLEQAARRIRISEELRQLLAGVSIGRACGGTILVCLLMVGWARVSDGFARHQPKNIPEKGLQLLLDRQRGEPVFHEYAWGGYLTWHGWKSGVLNWIDDRNEVQGREHIEEHFAILHARPEWQRKLDEHGFGWVCVRPDTPLAQHLAASADWADVYRDDFIVIYQRQSQNR